MSRLFFTLIAAGVVAAAGAVSAQSGQMDTSTQTQTNGLSLKPGKRVLGRQLLLGI